MEQTTANFYGVLFKQGIAKRLNRNIKVEMFNDYLKTIGYVAIKWPDSEDVILKQCSKNSKKVFGSILHPWNESTSKNAYEAIIKICKDEPVDDVEIIKLLFKENYIKAAEEKGRYELTLKSTVNFQDFLLKFYPNKYKKCDTCGIIVYGRSMHFACEKELFESRKS